MSALAWLTRAAVNVAAVSVACYLAYTIRLHAITTYGRVIHEFDPWFNYRATVYLDQNGLERFFKWFDYMSWYPLGRPVGTTIYPGMQMTSVFLKHVLLRLGISEIPYSPNNGLPFPSGPPELLKSAYATGSDTRNEKDLLNDICVFVPAWFGVTATIFLGLLAYECSGKSTAAAFASLIMSIIPAHIMRSVGGGYDNESIAVTAMCLTFYLWCRSLRTDNSWPVAFLAGLAYVYMVAAWGGYIFVVNMIALHAAFLVGVGRYSTKIYLAYSIFYVVGTAGAIQVPVVGLTPLKSLEQMLPLIVFFGIQVVAFVENFIRRGNDQFNGAKAVSQLYVKVGLVCLGVLFVAWTIGMQAGYFGPLSSRVRGLFVKHTRTGNPLVDSVAEHQPASAQAYYQFLRNMCYLAPIGWVLCMIRPGVKAELAKSDANVFLVLYGGVAYYFCSKMSRLIILLGPVASALSGIAGAFLVEWSVEQLKAIISPDSKAKPSNDADADADTDADTDAKGKKKSSGTALGAKGNKAKTVAPKPVKPRNEFIDLAPYREMYNSETGKNVRKVGAVAILFGLSQISTDFYAYSVMMAEHMSGPSIMYQARLQNGKSIVVDDYREAYWWLRDNTPEDARIMSWWDYGYQITGIANRTTIADGNTWNHEHIATLGRCLTSPEKKAHKIVRHLADYVLVWAGGGGDDLAKSPHMARIGTSVYDDICPDDPTCRSFGFIDNHMTPTPMMEASLLYKLHMHGQRPGTSINPELFEEAFSSKYGKVRIFKVLKVSKKSKKWSADPANRICDAPGSWYCVGQYPPALDELMNKKKAFKQLEDFNKGASTENNTHYQKYMKAMGGK